MKPRINAEEAARLFSNKSGYAWRGTLYRAETRGRFAQSGVGVHWTPDPSVAFDYAEMYRKHNNGRPAEIRKRVASFKKVLGWNSPEWNSLVQGVKDAQARHPVMLQRVSLIEMASRRAIRAGYDAAYGGSVFGVKDYRPWIKVRASRRAKAHTRRLK